MTFLHTPPVVFRHVLNRDFIDYTCRIYCLHIAASSAVTNNVTIPPPK